VSTVLFLSLVGPPDGVSTARLVAGLAAGLQRQGHIATILTTSPHYNRDDVAERIQPIAWGRFGIIGRSQSDGVEVVHVAMPRKSRSVLLRFVAWLWFHLASTALALVAMPNADVIVAPSPPLTIGVSAWLVSRLRGSRFIYNVQEIYPDIAVQLGAIRSPGIIRALRVLERFVYRHADSLTVISEGMASNLLSKGVRSSKVKLIPNYVDMIETSAHAGRNAFSECHGLRDKFVVTYAGNMGQPQGLQVVVECAEALRGEASILFLLVGDGSEKPQILRRIKSSGLSNVLVLPYQPYSRVPDIYDASHVCLVLQTAGTGGVVLPSKAVQIVGAGRPIIAVTDAGSDLARFVEATGSGLVASPGRPDELAAHVLSIMRDFVTWRARAQAARAMVSERYSQIRMVSEYSQLIASLLATR
jgi:putative colanic acid biosynthesis glycosyltransferase WcaI